MMKLRRWRCLGMAGVGLTLATLTGCQTWTYQSGLTVPSGHYLQHRPQYIPPSPDFPLERELAYMQQQQPGPGVAAGLPQPVVPPLP